MPVLKKPKPAAIMNPKTNALKVLTQLEIQQLVVTETMPNVTECQLWVDTALTMATDPFVVPPLITLRFVDNAESKSLNQQWREQAKATNVLSFPIDTPPGITEEIWLGDLILCVPVIGQEAIEQHKTWQAHWAHIIIHGVLHLLGYDHVQTEDAEQMEGLEIQILKQLGYPNPYDYQD